MKCQQGSSTVEFVLVFPFVLVCFLAVTFLAVTILQTHREFYHAYQKERARKSQTLAQRYYIDDN